MDRTQLDAMVSFMIVHHAIPALPVVCGKGENSEYVETVASSHDILAECMRFQMLHAEHFTMAALARSRDAKEALLLELHSDIAAVVGPVPNAISDAQVDACYALFCTAARAYHAQYPGSPDLRIRDMDSVCRSDLVHAQTLAHLRSREGMFESEEGDRPLAVGALSSYRELIRAAVEQLVAAQAVA